MKSIITFIILTFSFMKPSTRTENQIPFDDVYSVYITSDLKASKEFYTNVLNFEIVFESSWFIYMQTAGERKFSFALMDGNHPSSPPSYGAFSGSGSFLTLQVSDAAGVYQKLKDAQVPITYLPLQERRLGTNQIWSNRSEWIIY